MKVILYASRKDHRKMFRKRKENCDLFHKLMLQIRFRNYTSVEINERQLKYIPNKIRYTRDCTSLHLLHFGLVLSIYHTPAPSSLLILIKIVVRRHQLDSTKTPKANRGKYMSLKRHARKTKRNPRIARYTGSRVPLRRINTAVAHKYFSFYHHAFVGFKDHLLKSISNEGLHSQD